jgi:hypothetical protein
MRPGIYWPRSDNQRPKNKHVLCSSYSSSNHVNLFRSKTSDTKTDFKSICIVNVPVCDVMCMIPILNHRAMNTHLNGGSEIPSPPIPWNTHALWWGHSGKERNVFPAGKWTPAAQCISLSIYWLSYVGFAKLACTVDQRKNAVKRPNSCLSVLVLVYSILITIILKTNLNASFPGTTATSYISVSPRMWSMLSVL